MTILFLDPVGTLGGAERCLLDLAASMRAAQPSLRMGLILGGAGPMVDHAERLGMEVTVVPLPRRLSRAGDSGISGFADMLQSSPALLAAGGSLSTYALQLDRAIRAFRPTLIHSNGMKMHLLSALLPRRGVPVVWHLRDFVGQRAIMAHVLRALSSRASGLFAISRSVAEDAARTLGRDDVTLIYDAIDTECFVADGPSVDLDALAGLTRPTQAVVRIGLIATYARWKGQEVFIDAASRYAALGGPSARFYIVGGTAYDTDASQFSAEELRARIAVHASTRPEPFGRTIAEAMSCGRALVIAKEGGAAELVTDGEDALAVPPREPSLLAEALLSLAKDPGLRARLGAAARITASRRYSRGRIGPEILAAHAHLRAQG